MLQNSAIIDEHCPTPLTHPVTSLLLLSQPHFPPPPSESINRPGSCLMGPSLENEDPESCLEHERGKSGSLEPTGILSHSKSLLLFEVPSSRNEFRRKWKKITRQQECDLHQQRRSNWHPFGQLTSVWTHELHFTSDKPFCTARTHTNAYRRQTLAELFSLKEAKEACILLFKWSSLWFWSQHLNIFWKGLRRNDLPSPARWIFRKHFGLLNLRRKRKIPEASPGALT